MESSNQPVIASPTPPVPPDPHGAAEIAVDGAEPVGAQGPASPAPGTVTSKPVRPIVNTFSNDVIGSVQSLLGTIVIAVFVITFVVQAFQIPSQSMENTLLVGDYLLVNKL